MGGVGILHQVSLIDTPSILKAARIPLRVSSMGFLVKQKQKYREPCHKPPLKKKSPESAPFTNGGEKKKEREKTKRKNKSKLYFQKFILPPTKVLNIVQ